MIADDVLRSALESVEGEPPVLTRDLDWDLAIPCNDCPFLRTSAFHEGVAASLPHYIETIEAGRFGHTCHKTDPRPHCDGPRNWTGRPKHCAGALMMLLKTGKGKDLQLPLLEALQAGKFDYGAMLAKAKADDRVFTLQQLLTFYLRKIKRRMRNRPSLAENL